VLAWDFETEAVETKLTALGETPQTYEVAKLTAEVASRSDRGSTCSAAASRLAV